MTGAWLNWRAWALALVFSILFGSLFGWLFAMGWQGTAICIALIALGLANCIASRDDWQDTIG